MRVRGNGKSIDFGYDLSDQVTSVDRDDPFVTLTTTTNFTLDKTGNRTKVAVVGGTTTTYAAANALNQYTTIGGAAATYGNNGNLSNYNLWSYSYDSMNRLTAASKTGTSASFYYDGLGRQVCRTINGTTTYSVWDGWNLFAEYSGGVQTQRWIYAGSDLIRSPGMYYYADGSGRTAYLVTGTGLAEQYFYDAYGTPTFADASNSQQSVSANGVAFLFNGQKWYPELGIYDLRNRAYLPEIGRFLQPDPIGFAGDSANIYRYCGNNPANWSDPTGLVSWPGLDGMFAPSRPGQFGKGLVEFTGGGVTIILSAGAVGTGWGTALGITGMGGGLVAYNYGIENMVASYSDSPAAIAAAHDPTGLGEAAGLAIAGEKGQVYGGLMDSSIGLMIDAPRAVSGKIPEIFGALKSAYELHESAIDAEELQLQEYRTSLIPEHVISWTTWSTAGDPFVTVDLSGPVWNFPLTVGATASDSEGGGGGFSSGLSLLGFVPVDSFRPSDGFGGGGGLGPPGGLEQAGWNKRHPPKKKGH